jgi:hypothetical protein
MVFLDWQPLLSRLEIRHLIRIHSSALLLMWAVLPVRFVTKADLEKLGLGHLLGTQLLRAYMHGYFVDARCATGCRVQTG